MWISIKYLCFYIIKFSTLDISINLNFKLIQLIKNNIYKIRLNMIE